MSSRIESRRITSLGSVWKADIRLTWDPPMFARSQTRQHSYVMKV